MSQLLTDELGQAFELMGETDKRLRGHTAVFNNISVVNNLTKGLSTSFGPCGQDKILQSKDDEITITNDGATILRMMDMTDNPISQLIVQLSESQENEIGDGTTGVVILANALLQQSKNLIEKGIHPVRIAENFENCLKIIVKYFENISEPIVNMELEMLNSAKTSLSSKIVSKSIEKFAEICVKSILFVADLKRKDVDFELINFEKHTGRDVSETELINGMVIKKEFSHPQMKKEYKNVKVALLACPFEPPKLKNKHSLLIKNPKEYKELEEYERQVFLDMIKSLKDAKTDLVICQWGFDDEANSLLFENNLPAIRWVGGNDMDLIALHINANIIARFEDLREEDLGLASVKEMTLGTENEKIVILESAGQAKAVTIVVKGSNDFIIEEAKRSLQDGLCSVRNILISDRIVYGGGSAEVSASLYLQQESEKYVGEEELCMLAFSRALEEIPITLAKNSGSDPLEILTELRKAHVESKNAYFLGVDCSGSGDSNMKNHCVFDTLNGKVNQLQLATQLVGMILKIDDVIISESN